MKKLLTTLAVGAGTTAAVLVPATAFAADDNYGPAETVALNIPGVIETGITLDADVTLSLVNLVHLTLDIFPTLFGH